ncbi:ABC transporter ATP-binding protein [Devosia rhizoryzae]|uniref:Sn-glycerol-3-phosphate ABC transporter ATP-binding protein UgpC n=1 Tax=Devosia rhizoryzae TaxID=2774137 RepID=A0ABX7C5J1_9HYPH|nr:sn-glycerol-3-phosphate ABC transporter ATP-binding protein UgpC [Devosia rhizoryzae]QQR39488.1 sn-glycerol-3-phosphate ABC transporter ATP-binding protein UgpC [Devosia rhizoryzae]
MTSVSINGVRKSYGPVDVIHGVDIDIEDGEFVVLVGPSGCGKSTLLRMIAGLEEISGGQIRIGQRVVNDVSAKDRDIAMVFQSYALYPHMTVADNMAFSLKLKGLDKTERDARIAKAAEILGLTPMLKRFPKQLSGGQRQRVAMGRAIVRNPQVFLFDEPLSNLDAKLRVEMRSEIKSLQHRLKTTMIYVTHDQIEAMTMADKIVVMRDGKVEQADTPLNLYDKPANKFVAAFIGSPSMNFIEGSVRGSAFVSNDGVTLPLPSATVVSDGQKLTYGIRPEHLALGNGDGIPAVVQLVEPTGAETMVQLRIGSSVVVGVFRDRITAKEGETIHIVPDSSRVHLFGADDLRLA